MTEYNLFAPHSAVTWTVCPLYLIPLNTTRCQFPLVEISSSPFSSPLHFRGHSGLLRSVFLVILHLIHVKAPNLVWCLTHGYFHKGQESDPTSSLTNHILQSYKTDHLKYYFHHNSSVAVRHLSLQAFSHLFSHRICITIPLRLRRIFF